MREINLWRPVAFGVYGFFISVPLVASWYKVLDKFVRKNNVKTFSDTLSQVALDQVLFAPLGIAVYFACTNILLGKSIEVIKDKLSDEYFSALKANYVTWPWIQLANFHFVPLVYRTVVVNTAALGWNSYMSWLNHRRHETDNSNNLK